MSDHIEDDLPEEHDTAAGAASLQQKRRRARGRPFAPGQSGNPDGAKPGRRHPALEALDAIGHERAQAVLDRVILAAESGDMRAAEIVLRRVWPERRGKPVRIDLPAVNTAADLVPAMARVAEAMACGDLSPEEAQSVTAVLEGQRRVIETRDMEARLKRIEDEDAIRGAS